MLLRQASFSDTLTGLVLDSLEKNCPILKDAQFYTKGGPADSLKSKRDGKTETIFRDLNQNNNATPPVPDYIPVIKKIISFDAKADVILEDRNEDPFTELAEQTRLEAEDAGFILQEKFFEANSASPLEFDGLRKLVPTANSKPVAANGIAVPLGNSDTNITAQQEAIEQLQKLIKTVRGGASHLYMNEFLKIRWLTIAKNLNYYRTSKDELGNEIEMIGNVIIRGAGYKKDGNLLLPFDETVGTAAAKCSSIFAVRWGERVDLTALTSVGVKARYAGQLGNFYINNVNFDMALALQNKSAIYQSKGWYL